MHFLSGAGSRRAHSTGAKEDRFKGGLTVFGYRVDELIEAEEDRRDPERLRLKMSDIHDPDSVCLVLRRLEEIRAAFRQRLRATEHGLLSQRPVPGEWSVIECVRHMLFAEDLYLNRFILQNDKPWNPLGLLPDFLIRWQG